MMTTPHSRHLVRWADEARFSGPPEWAPEATGARRWTAVDDQTHAVHTGFGICELEPGSSLPGHVHSFEQSFFVLEGEVVLTNPEGSFLLGPDDYGLLPVGVPHAWRNESGVTARWADMLAPQPRRHYHGDTMQVDLAHEARAVPLEEPRAVVRHCKTPLPRPVPRDGVNPCAPSACASVSLPVLSQRS